MNIEQAKTISIAEILERLGFTPQKERARQLWYLSPFRNEKTASLHVHVDKNVWYDFGEGKGGDALELVCQWLKRTGEDHTVADGLRWLSNMTGEVRTIARIESRTGEKEESGLLLLGTKEIQHPALIRYLQERGIPLSLARRYLKHAIVLNRETGKKFFALSFANEEGGHELRNSQRKACVAPKAITFIRGAVAKPKAIHLFEGCFDFISVLANRKCSQLQEDSIVLNSLSCLHQAAPYIKGFDYQVLYSWLDNDPAGDGTTQALADFVRTEEGLTIYAMNHLYKPHKDVNAWHMHECGLMPL